jgi:hypothetical protein
MVADAQRSRAPIQKVADIVAGYFVPAVVVIAILTFLVWAIAAPEQPALAWASAHVVLPEATDFVAASSSIRWVVPVKGCCIPISCRIVLMESSDD